MIVVMPHGHAVQSASVGPFALVPPVGQPGCATSGCSPAICSTGHPVCRAQLPRLRGRGRPGDRRALDGRVSGHRDRPRSSGARSATCSRTAAASAISARSRPATPIETQWPWKEAAREPRHEEEPDAALSGQRSAGDRNGWRRDNALVTPLQRAGRERTLVGLPWRARLQRVAEPAARDGAAALRRTARVRSMLGRPACWSRSWWRARQRRFAQAARRRRTG